MRVSILLFATALALAGPALAEDQADTMAYIASLKAQRAQALDAQALAEAQREWLRAELAKAQKKLDEKPAGDKQ